MSGQSSSGNSSNLYNFNQNYGNANNFNQQIANFQKKYLSNLYGQAGNLFGNTMGNMNSQIPGVQEYMNMIRDQGGKALQDQLKGGAYAGVDSAAVQNQLQQSMNDPSKTSQIYAQMMGGQGNNYADAMKGTYMQDAQKAQEQMLSNLDARAAGAGMSGSSRHGVAEGLGMRDINQNLQQNLAKTGYETFDKDLSNKLGIAQQADTNTLQRQQMMQGMLSGKQNAMTGGLSNAGGIQNLGMGSFAPGMMPWQALGQYANILGNPIVTNTGQGSGWGSGTGSGSGSSSSKSGGGGI